MREVLVDVAEHSDGAVIVTGCVCVLDQHAAVSLAPLQLGARQSAALQVSPGKAQTTTHTIHAPHTTIARTALHVSPGEVGHSEAAGRHAQTGRTEGA